MSRVFVSAIGFGICFGLMPGFVAPASGMDLFRNVPDNGFFAPLSSVNAATATYADSGWLGVVVGGSTFTCAEIELGLAAIGSTSGGTTDLVFTLNDGDPSGLVFGSGATLYSTTIPNVTIPPGDGSSPVYWNIRIALPNVTTLGGFNNIGWSVSCQNFNYAGQFGFQVSTAAGQHFGFHTNNASFDEGSGPNLFSFGSDPSTGVANFVAIIRDTPTCIADVDDGTGSGSRDSGVGIEDLLFYLTVFDAGLQAADVDNGSGTGIIDFGVGIEDLLYFLTRFESGC